MSNRRVVRKLTLQISAICLGLGGLLPLSYAAKQVPVQAPSVQDTQQDLIARGQYLAIAADCAACHTDPGTQQPFAGGYAIHSPMGVIYSTNITPSKQFGIGTYSEQQFEQAVRHGIRADGSHLYPAMPYASYAGLTDDDVHALYSYFMQNVTPVDTHNKTTALSFPFNIRQMMWGWNLLFLKSGSYQNDPSQSAEWNRGKYLVDNLEHCGECHSPRNMMMAQKQGNDALSGAALGSWYAPNLTSDKLSGLGSWSREQLAQYLQTGDVPGKAQAAGPMAEAVTNSLQHLHDGDIEAIITYLQSLPAVAHPQQSKPTGDFGQASNVDTDVRGTAPMGIGLSQEMSGKALYDSACASCHQPDGQGTADHFYPSLIHNTATGGNTPNNLISAILFGVQREVKGKAIFMPNFGPDSQVQALSDQQIASLSNYIFQQYGNPDLHVTPEQVTVLRQGGKQPLLARIAGPASIGGIVLVVLIVLIVVIRRARQKSRG
ncbi:cytochrome c [Rosenbergiella australiborealis]|uniref:cytochrome c n=1 Tax=Rosenbergiella australiborealis TaxID=1544696 RepID=UPI001F4E4EE2|nr:cytochrome c [Rosenbergiella australiborealis]